MQRLNREYMVRWVLRSVLIVAVMTTASAPARADEPVAPDALLASLRAFAGNMIEKARDRYGPKQTPLFVCQLDLDRDTLPPPDSKLYRTDTRGGAGPTMNNLQFDTALIRFLDAMTQATGDPAYAAAVDEYLAYYLEHLPERSTGLFPWGDHRGYDVVSDTIVGGPHEFKCTRPPWARLYAVNPEAVTRAIKSLRLHIYDEAKSLAFSRHYPFGKEHPPQHELLGLRLGCRLGLSCSGNGRRRIRPVGSRDGRLLRVDTRPKHAPAGGSPL